MISADHVTDACMMKQIAEPAGDPRFEQPFQSCAELRVIVTDTVSKGGNRGHCEAIASVCKRLPGLISVREVGKALGSDRRRITGEAGRYYSGCIPWVVGRPSDAYRILMEAPAKGFH